MTRLLTFLDADRAAPVHGAAGALAEEAATRPSAGDWSRWFPFAFLHAGCLAVVWAGWSPVAVLAAVALYWARMFAITAFYHRYFSHRTFQTSRVMQCLFAIFAMTSVQRGPLWWASHHRRHHRHADQDFRDPHSPVLQGFLAAHVGWMTVPGNLQTDYALVRDLARFPELVFLNRFDWLVPLLYAGGLYGAGAWLQAAFPSWGVTGFQLLAWGFFISTVALFHGTCTINSLAHQFGSRRYPTPDDSRNNFWLALITLGEGWHNNHHRFQGSTRQGHYWWEVDVTYYLLVAMRSLGLVYALRPVPAEVYDHAREDGR